MTKHTPGPWISVITRNGDGQITDATIEASGIRAQVGSVVLDSIQPDCHLNVEANCWLMAAGPDLLADAKAVLDLVESEGRDTGMGGPFSDLRDSIAMAEGFVMPIVNRGTTAKPARAKPRHG